MKFSRRALEDWSFRCRRYQHPDEGKPDAGNRLDEQEGVHRAGCNQMRIGHQNINIPHSRRLIKPHGRSGLALPTMTWSTSVIPSTRPALTMSRVAFRSSLLGVGSPDGCWCAKMIWAADLTGWKWTQRTYSLAARTKGKTDEETIQ